MRASLVVSFIVGSCIAVGLVIGRASAQGAAPASSAQSAAPATAAPPPPTAAPAVRAAPATPAGAARRPTPGAAPAAPAGTATPAAPGAAVGPVDAAGAAPSQQGAGEPPPEGFDMAAALRGAGPGLTADEAAKRAAKTAPSVARAQAAARRAERAASQANVALYPRLELEARYTLLSKIPPPAFVEEQAAMLPAGTENPLADAFRTQQHTGLLEARLTYPVSALFFSIMPRIKAAKKSAESSKLLERVQSQSVALQTREAFYNYARARAALMVAKSALAQAEAHRRDVDALVNAGSLARVELMRADAQVATARVAVSRTQGSVAVARSGLYTLMHFEGKEDVTVNEDFEVQLPALTENTDALLAKALANRSELKQLRLSLDALEHNVDAAQGDQLPTLAIGGTADYANPNQRYFGAANEWHESWAAFASLTWSPNDWQTSSRVADQARADIAQTLADLEQLEDALKIEVTQAYEDYTSALAALESSRAGIAAADESYRVRREQFRAGAAVATDVIDAEGELRTARLDLVNAVIDSRIAKSRLDRAVEAP